MNVLFDTNVILDVMLDREPFSETAVQLLAYVEKGRIDGAICATTVTTIHYLSSKILGQKQAARHIESLMRLFDIAPVTRAVIEYALKSDFSDFEDAVIDQAALNAGADAIVTRDSKGFLTSELSVYSPDHMLTLIQAME